MFIWRTQYDFGLDEPGAGLLLHLGGGQSRGGGGVVERQQGMPPGNVPQSVSKAAHPILFLFLVIVEEISKVELPGCGGGGGGELEAAEGT